MLAESEAMTLTGFTAFTMQWRTCYPFNTQAGPPVFYQEFERLLDALLHPDYSDEEIRREVRNFGIVRGPGDHANSASRRKGLSTTRWSAPRGSSSRSCSTPCFAPSTGPNHPLAFNSGGEPSGIREMLPADIRSSTANIISSATWVALCLCPRARRSMLTLAHVDRILNRVQPEPVHYPVQTEANLPKPDPSLQAASRFTTSRRKTINNPARSRSSGPQTAT